MSYPGETQAPLITFFAYNSPAIEYTTWTPKVDW